jgi:exodeoxyribonuclease-1
MPFDYLPHPMACLVTGITPNFSLAKGLSEPNFAHKIYQQLSQANTCVAGYNSMRFDEEVTRHLLFRNLYPVYEREFKNNNSRWDVIDLVRACYALRPDEINWPKYEDGKPSFKLEELSKANNIGHEAAHDALSDVHATIGIAKLIKTKQPKLY